MKNDVWKRALDAIISGDRPLAVRIITQWAENHGYLSAMDDILEPTLDAIGRDYDSGRPVSIAHGYIAAKVVEEILGRAAQAGDQPVRPFRGAVVIGNIEDDYHALGRRMVGTFLRLEGWHVHDLGNDVPAASFVDMAIAVEAKVIGVSAMMHTTALNIVKVRSEIDARGLRGKLQLAVGGAIFVLRPELLETVGGDGTAKNAIRAAVLVSELWARAQGRETGNDRS